MIINTVARNSQLEKRVLLRDAKETFINVMPQWILVSGYIPVANHP